VSRRSSTSSAQSLTNPEIGDRLGISVETVKQHVSEILSKLGVATREEAAAWQSGHDRSFGRIILGVASLGVVAAAVAGLALLAWGVSRSGNGESPSTQSLAGILPGPVYYLPPDDGSPLISAPDLINQAGITVVSNPEELKAADPGKYIAVIVDKEWWDGLGQSWLALREAEGVVLVGARIDIAGFNDGWSAQFPNFFTLRDACGRAQNYLDQHGVSDFRFMLGMIASHARQSACLATPTPAKPA